ncbi:MAG: hypothetical protein JO261_12215 [Alphaproteobacteria bacterium]|nr:hypothetical protein [Alphaproteobacteria bacterium]MBV9694455.1 hypothetical protein [Alphaproteobacteria bacterium]
MLTGDAHDPAAALAKAAKISHWQAWVAPMDIAARVAALRAQGHRVPMIIEQPRYMKLMSRTAAELEELAAPIECTADGTTASM